MTEQQRGVTNKQTIADKEKEEAGGRSSTSMPQGSRINRSPSSSDGDKAGATLMESITPRQDCADPRPTAGPAAVNTASCIVQEHTATSTADDGRLSAVVTSATTVDVDGDAGAEEKDDDDDDDKKPSADGMANATSAAAAGVASAPAITIRRNEHGNRFCSVGDCQKQGRRNFGWMCMAHYRELEERDPATAVAAADTPKSQRAIDPPRNSFVAVLTKPMGLILKKMGDDSIKVSAIKPGSVADREGQVKIGDVLLAVNGKNVREKAVSEAAAIIEKSGEIVSMLFSAHRGYVSPSASATVVTPSPAKGRSNRCCVEGCSKYKQNYNHGMCRAHYLDSQTNAISDRTQGKPRKPGPGSPSIIRGKPPATRNACNKKGSELARELPGKRKRSAPTANTKYTPPTIRVGEKVMKFFTDDFYEGKVKRLPTSGSPVFFVVYSDGDSEEMEEDDFWAAYSDYRVQKDMIEPSEFVPDSLVVANDGRLATVRSFRPVSNGIDTEWSYHVHFTGWPASYDKWMLEVDLRKQTASTLRWAEKVRASLRIKDRHSKKIKTEAKSPSPVSQPVTSSRTEARKVATKTPQRQSSVDHSYPLRNASSPGIKTDTSTKKPPLRRARSTIIGKPSSSQRPAKTAKARMAPSTSIGCDVIMKQYPLRSSEPRSRRAAINAKQKLSTPRKELPKRPKKTVQRKNLSSSKPKTDDKKSNNVSDAEKCILPSIVVGTSILKYFSEGKDYFEGKITSLPTQGNTFYRIRYQDGDEEDMDPLEMYMAFSDWCVANDEIPLTKVRNEAPLIRFM